MEQTNKEPRINWVEGTVKFPMAFARDPDGKFTGLVTVPGLNGLTIVQASKRADIEPKLRTATVQALRHYMHHYDMCRRRAVWMGLKMEEGWWFTIIGIGLSYTKSKPLKERFVFINAWKWEKSK